MKDGERERENTSNLSAHIRMLKEQTAPLNFLQLLLYSKCPEAYSPHVVISLLGPLRSNRYNGSCDICIKQSSRQMFVGNYPL